MQHFLIALQFLTIFPVKIKSQIENKSFGRSLAYFPVVGALVGLIAASISLVSHFLPYLVTMALILIILIVITGGIHLDGFADTCDGFYGSRPKEKILEIMRDSHIGTMGVIAVVCLLLLKFTLLLSIPRESLWRVVIAMTIFARWSQVAACCFSSYSREEGKAKNFIGHAGWKELSIGGLFTVISLLWLMKIKGLSLFLLSVAMISLFITYAKRKIEGMTGDTIGATSEIAEVSIIFFFIML
jgi:adenosylcobinamide-GDP ribazoletransferase